MNKIRESVLRILLISAFAIPTSYFGALPFLLYSTFVLVVIYKVDRIIPISFITTAGLIFIDFSFDYSYYIKYHGMIISLLILLLICTILYSIERKSVLVGYVINLVLFLSISIYYLAQIYHMRYFGDLFSISSIGRARYILDVMDCIVFLTTPQDISFFLYIILVSAIIFKHIIETKKELSIAIKPSMVEDYIIQPVSVSECSTKTQ